MKRLATGLIGFLSASLPTLALATEPSSGYQGIAGMYYTLISVVLIYGAYDTFGKMGLFIGTPIIVILATILVMAAPA